MDFGRIIFMASLIGGEIMRWLNKNWRVVALVTGLILMIVVDLVT